MYSRVVSSKWLWAFLLVFANLLVSSCGPTWRARGLPFLETPRGPGVLILKSSETQCLSRAPELAERYFNGDLSAVEVDNFWRCSARAAQLFSTYFHGKDDQHYTPGELRTFLEVYFLGNFKLSNQLLIQIMKLKQMFLGGSEKYLTQPELKASQGLFENLRQAFQLMRPYMKLLKLAQGDVMPAPVPGAEVEAAIQQMQEAAKIIGGLLVQSPVVYKTADFSVFLEELSQLETNGTRWAGPYRLLRYIPLIRAFRTSLTSAKEDEIQPSDWGQTISLGTRVYAQWLRYRLYVGRTGWQVGDGYKSIADFGFESLDIVEQAVRNHPNNLVPYTALYELLERLDEFSMIPFGLTKRTAISVVKPLFTRYFKPIESNVIDPRAENGVTLAAVQQAREEFEIWARNQKAIADFLRISDPISNFGLPHTLRISSQFSSDMSKMMNQPYKLLLDERNRLRMSRSVLNENWDVKSLSHLNWRRGFVRMVIRGYAESKERGLQLTGLTRDEFKKFHDDIKYFARELQILDPRDPNVWSTIFAESNVFTYSADGNEMLSLTEGVEIISYAMSVSAIDGKTWKDAIQYAQDQSQENQKCFAGTASPEVKQACEQREKSEHRRLVMNLVGPVDLFKILTIDPLSFRAFFSSNFSAIYANFSGLAQTFTQMPPEAKQDFLTTLEQAGRCQGSNDKELVESSDLDKFTMMFHYMESVFVRFDENGDGFLSNHEVKKMFPLVRNMMRSKINQGDDTLWKILTYMVAKGEVLTDSWGDMWSLMRWSSNGEFKGPRGNLLKVFSALRGTPTDDDKIFCGPPSTWKQKLVTDP